MVTQMQVVQLAERVRRLAFTVSVVFLLGLLSVAVAVLGNALGGGPLSFLLALMLIGALTVLVLNMVIHSLSHPQAVPTQNDTLHEVTRERMAA